MVQANELRKGNWLLLGKEYEFVYQILYDRNKGVSINHPDYKEEWFMPIPLCAEILEKCGFVFYEGNNSWQLDINFGLSLWGRDGKVNLYHESDEIGIDITTLHQLQNVHSALTGTELKIIL